MTTNEYKYKKEGVNMKRFVILMIVAMLLLTGCVTGSDKDQQESEPPTNGSQEDGREENDTQEDVKKIEIPLLEDETLVEATTVDVYSMVADEKTAKVTLAVLSNNDSAAEGSFYVDLRDADGNVISWRRFYGVGFVANSDYGLCIFVVEAKDKASKTLAGRCVTLMVSDMELNGSPRDKVDFTISDSCYVDAVRLDGREHALTNFLNESTSKLLKASNPYAIAEIRLNGTKRIIDPKTPVAAESIRKIGRLQAEDFEGFFN